MPLQALPQPVLDGDVTGLLGGELHQQQPQILDAAAIVEDQLHPLIAAIHRRPHQQPRIHHQVIGQARKRLGKHHRLTGTGEVLQLQHRHAVPLAGGHLAQLGHHRHHAHFGLVGLLLQAAQADRGQQVHLAAQLAQGVVGDVEAEKLLFQLELLPRRIVGHRGGLRSGGEIRGSHCGIGGGGGEQIKEVALAAGPVLRPGGGPVEDQVKVGHQLGPVGAGVEGIEGAAVDQRFDRAAVELLAAEAVTEVRKRLE